MSSLLGTLTQRTHLQEASPGQHEHRGHLEPGGVADRLPHLLQLAEGGVRGREPGGVADRLPYLLQLGEGESGGGNLGAWRTVSPTSCNWGRSYLYHLLSCKKNG